MIRKALTATLIFVTIAAFIPATAHSTEPLSREEMVRSAYRTLPALLSFITHLANFNPDDKRKGPPLIANSHERALFQRIVELAASNKVPLEFSDDRESFKLNPNEPERLMRSTAVQDTSTGTNLDDGKIFVNRALLNSPEVNYDLATILKLLFHEFAHKTPETNWGVRDRLAQIFSNQISPYITEQNIRDGADLLLVSLPAKKIDKLIAAQNSGEPMATNLILLRLDGRYIDLTDDLYKRSRETTSLLRSMWTEANRAIMAIATSMAKVMQTVMQPIFQQFHRWASETFGQQFSTDNPFDRMSTDLKEIRILEVHEATSSAVANGIFLSIRATYTISRTDKNQMPIQVSGFPWKESFDVPVTLRVLIPAKPSASAVAGEPAAPEVDVEMRPNADYLTTGKILGVSRSGGVVSGFKVKFKSEPDQAVGRVGLLVTFGMGQLTLPAARVTTLENGFSEAIFELPAQFYPPGVTLAADAILINNERTVFLDRMITLSGDDTASQFVPHAAHHNRFVENSVGIWGIEKGQDTFRRNFEFKDLVWILDNVNSERFTLNHSRLKLEFQLEREERIREIRLHVKRNLIALDVNPDRGEKGKDDPPIQIASQPIEGKIYRFASGGGMKEQRDVHDIAFVDANDIYYSYPPNAQGKQKVQATLSIPFHEMAAVKSDNEAYAPPMGYPYLIEVVTENLQTLRYYFQDPDKPHEDHTCEFDLASAMNPRP